MTMTIDSGKIRCASGSDAISINSFNNVSIKKREGYSASTPAFRSTDIKLNNPAATTGWYWLNLGGTVNQYWIDMDYDGGGWVCVITHPINVAIPQINYATAGQSHIHSGSAGFVRGTSNPHAYATWLGLNAWELICAQNGSSSNKSAVYFTAGSQVALGSIDSHSRRSRWSWGGWNSNYSWRNVNTLVNEVGGTTPGFWSYHISNGYALTTYDVDQDAASGNCSSAAHGYAPWWWGACWDGNVWGCNGGTNYPGQANAAYWTGSGGDYYNFGAVYIR